MRPSTFSYIAHQRGLSDFLFVPSPGGTIFQAQAVVALNVGDTVQISGQKVTKATNNLTRVCGVVVGGESLGDDGIFDPGELTDAQIKALIEAGIEAAPIDGLVYILVRGIAYVVTDGVVANGALIKPSDATSGQVETATADTDQGLIVGKLFDIASTGATQARLALINLM
jgi:hypothetical protein